MREIVGRPGLVLSTMGLAGLLACQACDDKEAESPASCVGSDLSLRLSDPVEVNNQLQLDIVLANDSGQTCALERQPWVTLTNDAADVEREVLGVASSVDDADSPAPSRLRAELIVAHGRSISATLTYLSGPGVCDEGGRAWVPTRLVVTLFDDSKVEAVWPGASVDDCQEAATRPGTYVGPFTSG